MKYDHITKSLSIRGRLILGFSAIILVLLLATGITLKKVYKVDTAARELIGTNIPLYDTTADLYIHVYQMQTAINNLAFTHDHKYKVEVEQIQTDINQFQSQIDNYLENSPDLTLNKNWDTTKLLLNQLNMLVTKIDDITSETLAIDMVTKEINPLVSKIFDNIDGVLNAEGQRSGGMLTIELQQLQQNSHSTMSSVATIEKTEYFLLIAGTLISILIVYFTTRGIINHVNIIRQHSNKIASGDLTQRIEVLSSDEMGQLSQDLNVMTESLVKITKLITEASHSMVSSLSEVRQSASFQSSGASQQATSINEITASLEEIEKSSAQTNEKAKALGETAERTRAKGQQGLEAIEQSINGMKVVRDKVQIIAQTILDLSNQTQQVGEITSAVNNLAQQSKMLALNASIEAVKAGEAGKGFSVVATEVKNLAEQSEQSTIQVQKILENIRHTAEKAVMVTEEGTKGVDVGTNLVEQTGEIVKSLTEVIYETTIATQQIEAAIRQESVGIEQITIGMNEINQVTASFVASTKQTMEAIENLSVIAKNIKEYIDIYKV
jgi:methyl-accepting chemotaxis protein